MLCVTRVFRVILLLLAVFCPLSLLASDHHPEEKGAGRKAGAAEQIPLFAPLPAPGKKVPIGNGFYLIYGFDKKPKLGMAIMKIEIFNQDGRKDTSREVTADAGMPSMKGAHETGDLPFIVSKKGDYLLPVNIVMPGDWEIRLTVIKDGKVIFRGRYNFDV